MNKAVLSLIGLCLISTASHAAIKDCASLKQEIDAKLQAKGVSGYELKIVSKASELAPGEIKVGSCNGGQDQITYFRG